MIAILDCSEINMEVLDTDMETTESNDCKGLSRDNRNTNGILAII